MWAASVLLNPFHGKIYQFPLPYKGQLPVAKHYLTDRMHTFKGFSDFGKVFSIHEEGVVSLPHALTVFDNSAEIWILAPVSTGTNRRHGGLSFGKTGPLITRILHPLIPWVLLQKCSANGSVPCAATTRPDLWQPTENTPNT